MADYNKTNTADKTDSFYRGPAGCSGCGECASPRRKRKRSYPTQVNGPGAHREHPTDYLGDAEPPSTSQKLPSCGSRTLMHLPDRERSQCHGNRLQVCRLKEVRMAQVFCYRSRNRRPVPLELLVLRMPQYCQVRNDGQLAASTCVPSRDELLPGQEVRRQHKRDLLAWPHTQGGHSDLRRFVALLLSPRRGRSSLYLCGCHELLSPMLHRRISAGHGLPTQAPRSSPTTPPIGWNYTSSLPPGQTAGWSSN